MKQYRQQTQKKEQGKKRADTLPLHHSKMNYFSQDMQVQNEVRNYRNL